MRIFTFVQSFWWTRTIDVVILVSLESEAADWHGEGALLEASGVSPLEQDGVELPGAEILITVLVKQRVDHVDHMGVQLLDMHN